MGVAERSLRKTIVYRARCFRDEAEQARYHDSNPTMPTETILGRLRDDMVKRGVVHDGEFHAGESAQRRLEFAMKLLDTYMQYPKPNVLLPLNFCVLPRLPVMKAFEKPLTFLLAPFCS